MTAFVAVCLTLTNPYVFKIGKSFLIWLFGFLTWLAAEWKSARAEVPSSASSNIAESQTPLRQSQHVDYGTNKRSENRMGSNMPNGKRPNGNPIDTAESQSNNQHDVDENVSEEQSLQIAATSSATESASGSGSRGSSVHAEQGPVNTLRESSDSRDFVWDSIRSLLRDGAKLTDSASPITIVVITVLFALFVVQAIAGVFSAKIATDRDGLSSSQHCGIWQFNEDAGGEAADRDDLNNYRKEARASQYARTCYNSQDPTEPFSCRVFYNQSIAYTTKTDQLCPFPSSELCHDGLYSAISFDTGYIDASVIGVNSPTTHKFRRTTSCSPLNMSEPYVLRSSKGDNSSAYYYQYGPKDDTNYTFTTSGHPFKWLVPVYSVK